MSWIVDNWKVLFSGIGVAVFGWLFFRNKTSIFKRMKQKGGKNSTNYQSGRDINIK